MKKRYLLSLIVLIGIISSVLCLSPEEIYAEDSALPGRRLSETEQNEQIDAMDFKIISQPDRLTEIFCFNVKNNSIALGLRNGQILVLDTDGNFK